MGKLKSIKAQHGDKMIKLQIDLWTNDLAEKGNIVPKHAWDSGVVKMRTNPSHGIVPNSPTPFHSIAQLSGAIEQLLIDHGIILHSSRLSSKHSPKD